VQDFHFTGHGGRTSNHECHCGGEFRKLQHLVSKKVKFATPKNRSEPKATLNSGQHHASSN
jgi:hypothetical protein